MQQILEAIMLVCFGLSWPFSLVRNIKAKTAKSMSIQFTVLIVVGYIAGIAAKLISKQTTYILAIYVYNLVVVSANLVVYFVNRSLDRKRDAERRVIYDVPECTGKVS